MKQKLTVPIFFLFLYTITGCKEKMTPVMKRNIRHTPIRKEYAEAIDIITEAYYTTFFEYMTISYGSDGIYKDIRIIQAKSCNILIYQDSIKGDSFFVPLKQTDYMEFIDKMKDIYERRTISERECFTGPSTGVESFCIRCSGNIVTDNIVVSNKSLLNDNDYRLKLAYLFEEFSRFVDEIY